MPSSPATASRRRSAIRWSSRKLWLAALLLLAPPAARAGGADGSFDRRESSHFVLYQDVDIDESGGFHGSRRFEQQVLGVLEDAYERIDDYLGLRPRRKIEVNIFDPAVFDRRFAGRFLFPAAGFYGGVICIRGATEVTDGLYRTLHHETVHAALDAHAPSYVYPAWLNEGTAEWVEARAFGKRGPSAAEWRYLQEQQRGGGLFTLAALSRPSFAHLDARRASTAYVESYAFIDFLVRRHGERSLRDLFDQLERTRDLDRAIRRAFRADLPELERRFLAELST